MTTSKIRLDHSYCKDCNAAVTERQLRFAHCSMKKLYDDVHALRPVELKLRRARLKLAGADSDSKHSRMLNVPFKILA